MALTQSPPGGSIIGISSISALVGGGEQAHYTPTKAGVLSLMQSCAVALGKYNIRCNALLPGTIRTQLNDADMADPEKRAYMEGRIPLGRLGQPPDLAGPAVFLACEELSSYVVSGFHVVAIGSIHADSLDRLVHRFWSMVDYLSICSRCIISSVPKRITHYATPEAIAITVNAKIASNVDGRMNRYRKLYY